MSRKRRSPHAQGYRTLWIRVAPGPRGRVQVYVHRHVMEQHLGRKLEPHEQVHHINGDKGDNRLENLEVVDIREHARMHSWNRVLQPERRAAVVALREQGLSQSEIARRIGLDPSSVCRHLQAAAGRPYRKPKKGGQ